MRDGHLEESVLDFFVVCARVLPHITSMLIDEKKKYVLTNFEQVRKGGKASDSDHFTQIMDIKLNLLPQKPIRKEIFNFKECAAQQKFKNLTSKTKDFTSCFSDKLPIMKQISNWRNILKSYFRKSFKKIRIKNQMKIKPLNPKISKLIDLRNSMLKKKEDSAKNADLNKVISEMEAEDNRNKIFENFQKFSENPGNINISQMWKTLKKLWPKCGPTLPTAKRNHKGKIVTGPQELKRLLAKE